MKQALGLFLSWPLHHIRHFFEADVLREAEHFGFPPSNANDGNREFTKHGELTTQINNSVRRMRLIQRHQILHHSTGNHGALKISSTEIFNF